MRNTNNKETSNDEVGLRAATALESGEDPGELNLRTAFRSFSRYLQPARVLKATAELGVEGAKILAGTSDVEVHPKDWRFKDPAWQENPIYKRLGQGYIAWCRSVESLVSDHGDWRNHERAKFAVDVLTSSLSPTNTLIGNPAALKHAVETRGRSLVSGARNLAHDIVYNGGMPTQVDTSNFTLGKNLATTPGAVVFRNEVLELIQYQPSTANVHSRPTLIIPPQINKFYFLDMSPGRSFVEFATGRGVPIFMVSWRNPTAAQADWNLDTYLSALLEAVDAVREITHSDTLNMFGFCAGGITMSALLGYFAAQGNSPVHSVGYAVTLLDWNVPAMIGMLQSDSVVNLAKANSKRKGVITGKELGRLFSWFRPNDLVWNYWVNNYLMGKPPPSFDILAWNDDSTNLPGGLHGEFLDIFARNSFTKPGLVKALGHPVDLGQIKCDAFVTGAVNDHLTPWRGCYRTTQLLGGKSTFVLSNAGHIASLVNPPGNPKASYFTGPQPGPDWDEWRNAASKQQGSWWEAWAGWIGERSGDKRSAPSQLGSAHNPATDNAPGTYVMSKS